MDGIQIDALEIETLLLAYVAIPSQTGTRRESAAAQFVHEYLRSQSYFQANPDLLGLFEVSGDPLERKVAWAMIKGDGPDTVVMVHHYDVVGVEDFLEYKALAFEPKALMSQLARSPQVLSPEAREDLESGQWLFGRGTADMKAGGAIQMVLMKKIAELAHFTGNVIMIAVPDEENTSAGMRSAILLLDQLKEKHGLRFKCLLNTEPHQRKNEGIGIVSGGSVGKTLPFVYVRGVLAHAGKSPEGFNPLQILSEIVTRTEMNPALSDERPEVGEMAPPPTWLMLRDSKGQYDVSMPLSAYGCLSVLSLTNEPGQLLQQLVDIAKQATETKGKAVHAAIGLYAKKTGRVLPYEKWSPRVMTFSGLLCEGEQLHGGAFVHVYEEALREAERGLIAGDTDYAKATWTLVDTLVDAIGVQIPLVVIGVQPPYYPSVSYLDRQDDRQGIESLYKKIDAYARDHFQQSYELEAYFTGISDLSYASLETPQVDLLEKNVAQQMPLYGGQYFLPFASIAKNAMPCINIGPWGKDFHKISERVLKEDAFHRTPSLVLLAIEKLLDKAPH